MATDNKQTKGLRRLTKAGSTPVRLKAGGKEFIRDTSKSRKYRVKGETNA